MRRAVAVAVLVLQTVSTMHTPVETAVERLHGDPVRAASWAVSQTGKGLCGPASVSMVVAQLRGFALGRREAAWAADRMDLLEYTSGGVLAGMYRPALVELFAEFDVDAAVVRTTVNGLRRFLDQGRGIILHVDSGELWNRGDRDADHFAVLTGIDDRRGVAILNDPGMGPAYGFAEGAGTAHAVSLSDLDAAWRDSGRHAVVTSASPRIAPA